MLLWSRGGRAAGAAVALALFAAVYALPFGMIGLAALAGDWNGVLPSHLTFAHLRAAFGGESAGELRASVLTGAAASAVALVAGTWAALALRTLAAGVRRPLEALFFLPSAIPSVSAGLGLLVAFSRKPLLLNGTVAIVLIAHLVLVSAFTFGNVSAGLRRLPSDIEQMAASLGARPAYVLRRVTLPLLAPYLLAAFSLSFALSMGELGATAMVYPPGWVTLPVGIFGLTDRGAVFDGAALTVLLGVATLLVLLAFGRISAPGSAR